MTADRVVVSYARSDGEEFARELLDQLPDSVGPVWMDRREMAGDERWWAQITRVIEQASYLVAVMTPGAIASSITRREWMHARKQGVRICPVMGVKGEAIDFDSLPRWMADRHFYDLEKEWDRFVSYISEDYDERRRMPFTAPDLLSHFVRRPVEFGQLKSQVLDPDRLDPVPISTAVSGSGGFGKTTLATALCHDEDVFAAFEDGILWVELGQEPDIIGKLTEVYASLTGERPGFASADDAANSLAERLEDRRCLLVIDDVWNYSHVAPFLRRAPSCTRVITTRMSDIASRVSEGTSAIEVDEMTGPEAIGLLTARLPHTPSDTHRLVELSDRLGNWALLLGLAGSLIADRVRRGQLLDDAIDYAVEAYDDGGLVAFERTNSEERNDAAARSVGVSLQRLDADDRERFEDLGIFVEDTAIPFEALGDLWGTSPRSTDRLAENFANLGLCRLSLAEHSIQLHDVIRDYLEDLISPRAEAVHQRFVEALGQPAELGYPFAWMWYTRHALLAGLPVDHLHDPSWLAKKLSATNDIASLVADFRSSVDEASAAIGGALQLSSSIIARDFSELPCQLLGRLYAVDTGQIDTFLERVAANSPGLLPTSACLTPPGGPLLHDLRGHTGPVMALAVLPDGHLGSAGGDGTVRIWDPTTGNELHTLHGHTGPVNALSVLSDGRLASASGDNTVRIWDLTTGNELHTLHGHTDGVRALADLPDGHLASAGGDNTVRIWDLTTGNELHTLHGHTGPVRALTVLPDGHLASAGGDGTVRTWDPTTGNELHTLHGHTTSVLNTTVLPDGHLASASSDNTIRIWDPISGTELHTLHGHTDWVRALTVLPDGQLASASGDSTIRIWDLTTVNELQTLHGHSGPVNALTVLPDGCLASASSDNTIRVWEPAIGNELRGHSAPINALTVLPNGYLASASYDNTIKIWDAVTDDELHTFHGHTGLVRALTVLPDGHLASASSDNTIRIWDPISGTELHTLHGHTTSVLNTTVLPDGRLASASYDNTIKIWDPTTGNELHTLHGHTDGVRALAVLPDGHLASASGDNTIRIWDPTTGNELHTLHGHTSPVLNITVLPDGHLASASSDNTIRIWDPTTGNELHTLHGHTSSVRALTVLPDGHLASAGGETSAISDSAIRVWDTAAGNEVHTLHGHTRSVNALTVLPDGRLASASYDNTIRIWDPISGTELQTLHGHTDWVSALTVLPDGHLASASYDHTVRVWDPTTGPARASFTGEGSQVALTTLPDGQLAVGTSAGRVYFLRWRPPESNGD